MRVADGRIFDVAADPASEKPALPGNHARGAATPATPAAYRRPGADSTDAGACAGRVTTSGHGGED